MHKLIIYCVYDPKANMKPTEVELDEEYNESQAELRALRWLLYRPNDLVMLVQLETGYNCAHCAEPIQEKAGFVLPKNKWVHSKTGARFCFGQDVNQAEPADG